LTPCLTVGGHPPLPEGVCVCVCFSLQLRNVVCQYSELPPFWLVLPTTSYAHTLGAFRSTSTGLLSGDSYEARYIGLQLRNTDLLGLLAT
jgi:hypothetical protein